MKVKRMGVLVQRRTSKLSQKRRVDLEAISSIAKGSARFVASSLDTTTAFVLVTLSGPIGSI